MPSPAPVSVSDAAGPATTPQAQPPRAGRDLGAAIGVGVGLGAAILAALLLWPPAFLGIIVLATVVGAWELTVALRSGRIDVPMLPVLLGALAIPVITYMTGEHGLALSTVCAVLVVLVWRSVAGSDAAVRDVAGGAFVTLYVSLLAGFCVLLLTTGADGPTRVLVFLILVICSDVGGYASGVFLGKHPMAPSVSPKKSWEGFAGSLLTSGVAGALTVWLMLDGFWLAGVVVGVAMAATATIGDLAESALKRDVGIKDMSAILPGHGGVMDRLDSLLVTAPVAWALLTVLV